MRSKIIIYIEGGGDSKNSKHKLRVGFRAFLGRFPSVSETKLRPRIFLCGSINSTFDKYKTGLLNNPEFFHVLLVDSDGPVTSSAVEHLATHKKWDFKGIDSDLIHLMVQEMEAWFFADKDALQAYYGTGFKINRLSNRANVEDIPKDELVPSLEDASKPTSKGKYQKIKHAADLLSLLDSSKVRKNANHCDQLFLRLEEIFNH